MILGVDLSIQEELDALGAKYYYRKKLVEPFSFFATHSHISMVRLRLWHDPYDEKRQPYGGGTNDLETTLKLARRARDNNMGIMNNIKKIMY